MANDFSQIREALDKIGNMTIAGLYPNRVMGRAITIGQPVNNNFAKEGDTVSFRKEPTATATRWKKGDSVPVTDMSPTLVDMVLNETIRVKFNADDIDWNNFGQYEMATFSRAAIRAIMQEAERIMIEKACSTHNLVSGSDPVTITDIRAMVKKADDLNLNDRRFGVVDNAIKSDLISLDQFIDASKRGDSGKAVQKGELGELFGINWIHSRAMRSKNADTETLAVNNASGYTAGATQIAFDGGSDSALTIGSIVRIGSVDYSVKSVAWGTAGESGVMTLSKGLEADVADDAAITLKYIGESVILNPDAVFFGSQALLPYEGKTSVIARDDYGAVRVTYDSDTDQMDNFIYFDMLCGAILTDPDKIFRIVN